MPTHKITTEILDAAILGFEEQKRGINVRIAELRAMLPGRNTPAATTPESIAPKRKRFSAAARRKMAATQKARWAKIKGDSEAPAPSEPAKPKRRKMSAAARAKIAAAQRKRWAASKKAAEPSSPQKAPKPKRKLSAAGRKAIIAATKKRLQKAGAKTKSTGAKKAAVKKATAKETAPVPVTTQAAD